MAIYICIIIYIGFLIPKHKRKKRRIIRCLKEIYIHNKKSNRRLHNEIIKEEKERKKTQTEKEKRKR